MAAFGSRGTRLQLQNELGKSLIPGQPRLGMFGTASSLVRNEGVLAMYKGLSAALLRQVVYGGIGIGFYGPVRCAPLSLWPCW